jgi:hypothetical protein
VGSGSASTTTSLPFLGGMLAVRYTVLRALLVKKAPLLVEGVGWREATEQHHHPDGVVQRRHCCAAPCLCCLLASAKRVGEQNGNGRGR